MMRLTLSVVGQALFSTDLSNQAQEIGVALNFALDETNRRNLAPFGVPFSTPYAQQRALQTRHRRVGQDCL